MSTVFAACTGGSVTAVSAGFAGASDGGAGAGSGGGDGAGSGAGVGCAAARAAHSAIKHIASPRVISRAHVSTKRARGATRDLRDLPLATRALRVAQSNALARYSWNPPDDPDDDFDPDFAFVDFVDFACDLAFVVRAVFFFVAAFLLVFLEVLPDFAVAVGFDDEAAAPAEPARNATMVRESNERIMVRMSTSFADRWARSRETLRSATQRSDSRFRDRCQVSIVLDVGRAGSENPRWHGT
jgi:hypothetical protein